MNNWKVLSQIAFAFGIIFVVFAAVTAFIDFEAITLQGSLFSQSTMQIYILSAMLPFLLSAVLSFVVAGVTVRVAKEHKSSVEKSQPELVHP